MADAPIGRTPYQQDLNKTRVEALYKSSTDRSRFVIDFALLGLRSLVLVNGGAIISLLTFLGHNQEMSIRGELWIGFGWFIAGLGAVLISIVMAYLSQQQFTLQEHQAAEQIFMNAYGQQERLENQAAQEANRNYRWGTIWQIVAIAGAVASFVCFALGALRTLGAVVQANASPLF